MNLEVFSKSLVLLALLMSFQAFAAPKKSEIQDSNLGLKKIAEKELNLQNYNSTQKQLDAPTATSILQVQDVSFEPSANFKAQRSLNIETTEISASGKISLPMGENYSAESLGSFRTIGLSYTWLVSSIPNSTWSTDVSLKGHLSQKDMELKSSSGYVFEDAKATTSFAAIEFGANRSLEKYPWLQVGISGELGLYSLTQSSSSIEAAWTGQSSFLGVSLRSQAKLSPRSHVLAKVSSLNLLKDDFELSIAPFLTLGLGADF